MLLKECTAAVLRHPEMRWQHVVERRVGATALGLGCGEPAEPHSIPPPGFSARHLVSLPAYRVPST